MTRSSIVFTHGARRARGLASRLGLALGVVLGAACGDTSSPVAPPISLDRPVDIAFACYGPLRITNGHPATADQDVIVTAQPTASCETRSQPPKPDTDDPTHLIENRPPGQEDSPTQVGTTDWYGFILESAQGTVALAHWASQPATAFMGSAGGEVQVLDADPLTPGKNAISIGEEPIAIATDKSGCYEVTANAGSCDLSVLDINSALAGLPIGASTNPGQAGAVRVDRIPVKNQMGTTILARPAAMIAEPSTDVIGNECKTFNPLDLTAKSGSALAPQGVAYIAYPSCHLVAAIDMSIKGTDGTVGRIVAGIQFDPMGGKQGEAKLLSADEVQTISCPAECGPSPTQVTPGTRPVTLAYRLDSLSNATPTRRLAIGADNSSSVTLVELGDNSLPVSLSQIKLEDATEKAGPGKLGVTSIALSPRIGMGGELGNTSDDRSPGGLGQYVYAVATDNTVRVVDVLNLGKECDTQVDTRFLRDSKSDDTRFMSGSIPALQCFVVGAPTTPPRRSGARGPGIELPGDGVPLSVAFVKAPPVPDAMHPAADSRPPAPATLLGTFAIITATNGQAFVVNVDDDDNAVSDTFVSSSPQLTAPTLVMAHQLRDTIPNRDQGAEVSPDMPSCLTLGAQGAGGPRATAAPLTFTAGGPMAASKALELPTIRQVQCETSTDPLHPLGDAPGPGIPVSEVMLAANSSIRDQVFPDLRGLSSDENWTLTWEGALSQDNAITAIDGPAIREAQMVVDSDVSARIEDTTHPFCSMGAEPFDILQIRGCDPTNQGLDCPSGYTCFVHPDRSVSIGGANIGECMRADEAPRLANACRDFLISLRRYTISTLDSGDLVLRPRQHVLRTTPLDGCTDNLQCKALADYAAQNASDAVAATTAANDDKWECRADDTRKPINSDPALNKRCVQRCAFHSKDSDNMDRDLGCDPGTICVGATAGDGADHLGFCMEGVMPPQACVNAPQRFEVRASEAFTVIGSRSGYVHPFIENPVKSDPNKSHACVIDPSLNPSQLQLQVGRVSLRAPACGDPDPLQTDPITGESPPGSGKLEPNPCSLMATQFENLKTFPDGNCDRPTIPNPAVGPRPAPAIKFRNRGLTLTVVDPYYPGDKTCPLDRQGPLDPTLATARIPLVFPGYQISFHQTSGYSPMSLSNVSAAFAPAFPVKVVEGPTHSIWVLDDGDSLSIMLGVPSTRGQVYRIESVNLGAINLLR
jgi:hypothetical protein